MNTTIIDRPAPALEAAPSRWSAAVAALEAAQAKYRGVSALNAQLEAEVGAEAPIPDELKMKGGETYYCRERITEARNLSFDEKARLIPIFDEWSRRRDAVRDRLGFDPASMEDLVNDADLEQWAEYRQLLATPAPDLTAVLYKARLSLTMKCADGSTEHADDLDMGSRILSESTDGQERELLRLYQDLLRVAGEDSPVLAAERFDAEAWAVSFEALPGHEVTPFGVCFHEPAAWGDDLSDATFTVTDPQVIDAYAARQRALHPDYVDGGGYKGGFVMGSKRMIREVFAGDEQKIVELEAAWDRRWSPDRNPMGRELWGSLTPWRRKLIIDFARDRDRDRERASRAAPLRGAL